MNGRLPLLAGPVFTVIFFVVTLLMSEEGPGQDASGKAVVDYVEGHEGQLFFTAFAAPALGALIVLFFSQLRTLARERSIAAGAGPSVMIAGAVLWAGGMLVSSMLELAVLGAADDNLEQAAQTLNVILEASWLPFIGGIAITLIGAGMTVLRTALLPRWLGWVALVCGIIALAGPGGFLGFFVGPLFMLIAGMMLLVRSDEPVGSVTEPV
ncbi:MAG TPA: hypothetical protein VM097_08825 [Mycobacteriales bacterium]|nr:hypothetical protein [Mycobacteriales bacterium]